MRTPQPETVAEGSWSGLLELWAEPALSGILAGGYLLLLSLMWVLLVFGVGRWGRRFLLRSEVPFHPPSILRREQPRRPARFLRRRAVHAAL